jgi:hypothetical protein
MVQVDAAAGCAEAARRVNDHRVTGPGERTRRRLAVGLGAAEAVRQYDGWPRSGRVRGQDRYIKLHRLAVRLGRTRHHQLGFEHLIFRVRRSRDARQQGNDQQ